MRQVSTHPNLKKFFEKPKRLAPISRVGYLPRAKRINKLHNIPQKQRQHIFLCRPKTEKSQATILQRFRPCKGPLLAHHAAIVPLAHARSNIPMQEWLTTIHPRIMLAFRQQSMPVMGCYVAKGVDRQKRHMLTLGWASKVQPHL